MVKDSPDDSRYFGMGPTTPEYASALLLLRQIKSESKRNRVVIGGPHAIANTKKCLTDGFDVVALGDGENITLETFESTGVVDMGRGRLDDYPIIDRHLVDIGSYRYRIGGRLATTLVTSRGCPYRCGFCANTERQVRYCGPDRIEREIAHLNDKWGYRALMIFDNVFISSAERARTICKVLKKFRMLWRCLVRGDLVVRHGQELVDVMADSGCVEVAIGIESGSGRILRTVCKDETLTSIRTAITILKNARIRVKGLFIIGLPGENRASLAETRRFVEQVPLDDADFTVYQPYRGSPIWDNRKDYDIGWYDMSLNKRFYKGRAGEYRCAVSTSSLTGAEIVKARDDLERIFREHNQLA